MKSKFTLLYILLLLSSGAFSQNLTGVWKGYFVQNSFGYYEDRYKFEVQIAQLANNAIQGVTYSYKTTVFYGKASLSGLYTNKTNVLTITETKLIEVKIQGQTEACLMTCYLEYAKMGDLETLTGTYNSRNVKDKGDCGSGKIYLEKTTTSDFYKEDFVLKREAELKKKTATKKTSVSAKPLAKKNTAPATAKKAIASGKATAQNSSATHKPLLKPGAEDAIVTKQDKSTPDKNQPAPQTVVIAPPDQQVKAPKPIMKLPKPEVMRKRDNEVIKTFYTSAKEIKIDLYDNGEIDGDTISVYDNNKLILSRKGLTDKAISYTLKIDENEPSHEFVMVAENEGSIPPNTALMVITAGGIRYELFVTSSEKKNAVVIVQYKPDQANE